MKNIKTKHLIRATARALSHDDLSNTAGGRPVDGTPLPSIKHDGTPLPSAHELPVANGTPLPA